MTLSVIWQTIKTWQYCLHFNQLHQSSFCFIMQHSLTRAKLNDAMRLYIPLKITRSFYLSKWIKGITCQLFQHFYSLDTCVSKFNLGNTSVMKTRLQKTVHLAFRIHFITIFEVHYFSPSAMKINNWKMNENEAMW